MNRSVKRRSRIFGSSVVTVALMAAMSVAGISSSASAAPTYAPEGTATTYAPEDTATIKPGVQMYTDGAQCTGNFVFTDDAGDTYVGYAAHCAGKGAATDTNGCTTESLPLGTAVTFNTGGSLLSEGKQVGTGTLAYSSWLTMQDVGETDANTCAYNDIALVQVDDEAVGDVNPTVPFWGGPNAVSRDGTVPGDNLYSYGNSSLRGGIELLSPKRGISVGDEGDGWSHTAYTLTPGIPGDSGSGFMDADGNAIGVLSTVAIAPLPASNGIGDLGLELDYANANSGLSGVNLVPGTTPFNPVL